MNYLALGVTVAVIGMFIGRTAFTAAGRGEVNSEKAAHKRYGVLLAFVVAGGALLIFDAVQTERHRYLDIAVLVLMVGGVAFDWIRARRHQTPS